MSETLGGHDSEELPKEQIDRSKEMNLDLTSKEMETLLSLTAGMSHHSEECEAIWRKVSKEFNRKWHEVKGVEDFKKEHGLKY